MEGFPPPDPPVQPLLFFSSPPFLLLALSFSPFRFLHYSDFGAGRAWGRTIRKVMGRGGVGEKEKKKFTQGKMRRKKNHAKEKVKKKNSCRRKVQL